MSLRVPRALLVMVCGAGILALSACGIGGSGGVVGGADGSIEGTSANPNLPAQNRTQWVMPLDEYVVTPAQMSRESYLHALISQACISEQGFAHVVPAPAALASSAGGEIRRIFDESSAAQYGYRGPQTDADADAAWLAYTQRPMSEDELSALDQCVRDLMADESVPKWTPQILEYTGNIAAAAVTGASEDASVRATKSAWADCVSDIGIEDLPTDPLEMPTSTMITRYGWENPNTGISQAERSDAVADAKCREQSGYSQAIYQAEWDRQVELLEANYDSFVSLGEQIREIDRTMIEQVALLAPAS